MKFIKSLKQKLDFRAQTIPKNLLILLNIGTLVLLVFLVHSFITKPKPLPQDTTVYSQNDQKIIEAATLVASECKNLDREKCYNDQFKKLIYSYNFSYAEQTLYVLQDIDQATKSCHVLSHFMARTAVQKNPDAWQSLLDSINVNACGSGFLHGVLESRLGDNPDTKFDSKLSEETCNRGNDDYRKRMCTHFMGHFFVVETNGNLKLATEDCGGVSPALRFDCLDGLFMEHNQKLALADHQLSPPPTYSPAYAADLEDNCSKFTNIEAVACWTEMAEVYAKTFGYDSKIVYDRCYTQAPDERTRHSCYFKGVVILATYPMELPPIALTSICGFYSVEHEYKPCITNLLSSLMYYSTKYTPRGIVVCESSKQYAGWCFNELGTLLSKFEPSSDQRLSLCVSATDEYKKLCARID